jgi:riboflavin kinase/FMN adenylyltransferase
MRLITTLPEAGALRRPQVLALGVFDGLHLGHRAVLAEALRQARRLGLPAAALSFDPVPEAALGQPVPLRLQHPAEQAEQLKALGLDRLYRVPFTAALGRLRPDAFAATVLAGRLACAQVVVGHGFRFGAGASGTVEALKALGQGLGFGVSEVAPARLGGHLASSTRLRHAVQGGDMGLAQRLLGRPWRLRGRVVSGRKLGRKLGFPTANLQSPQQALPPKGVWAGRVRVLSVNGPGAWKGFVGNLGQRPTLGQGLAPSIELHLLGFKGRLNGRTLEAEFLKHLRPERRFAGLDALKAQIGRDRERAAAWLKGRLDP